VLVVEYCWMRTASTCSAHRWCLGAFLTLFRLGGCRSRAWCCRLRDQRSCEHKENGAESRGKRYQAIMRTEMSGHERVLVRFQMIIRRSDEFVTYPSRQKLAPASCLPHEGRPSEQECYALQQQEFSDPPVTGSSMDGVLEVAVPHWPTGDPFPQLTRSCDRLSQEERSFPFCRSATGSQYL
jgi:hypothetical protein